MIDNTQGYIDSRDVITRIKQLSAIRQPGPVPYGVLEDEDYLTDQDSLFAELSLLEKLEGDCAGVPDWEYGATLIRDYDFEDYARELADDIGAIDSEAGWPLSYIDWPAAARALQIDYIDVDFDGVTYWVRA